MLKVGRYQPQKIQSSHLNPEKCEAMRITHNRDKSSPSDTMEVVIKPVKCVTCRRELKLKPL